MLMRGAGLAWCCCDEWGEGAREVGGGEMKHVMGSTWVCGMVDSLGARRSIS
jgi:hypothetical protein